MKLSNILLATLFLCVTIGMVASNYILKNEYDKIDKTDPFWNFKSICDKPFKHLKITGGNRGNVYFEPGNNPSVKTGHNWEVNELLGIKADVINDTLFLSFPDSFLFGRDEQDYYYAKTNSIIRITTPLLLSISGNNCKILMDKMDQTNYKMNLTGKSTFRIQSINKAIQNLEIQSSDSSKLSFVVSNDAKDKNSLKVENCSALLTGASHLSVPGAIIGTLKLRMNDQSSVELNGYNMKRLKQEGEFLTCK